jgi:preprotein translocase subunit SecD
MSYPARLLPALLLLGIQTGGWCQDKTAAPRKQLLDGVYLVKRDSVRKMDVLPVRKDEALLLDPQRYLPKTAKEAPRFVVVRLPRALALELSEAPKAVKDKGEVVRILLKLKPRAAAALERLTREQRGRQLAIVLGGQVVTMHKIRGVIKGGEVQITSCAPGAANYLLKRLQGLSKIR